MSQPGTGIRERKKQRTRQALRQAAVQLFLERGFEATTIADITEAADVAPRTFFSYFQTKEDVVLDEAAQRFAKAQTTLQQRPKDEPLLAAFRRAALEIAADIQTQSDQEPAMARVIRSTPAIQARIRDRMGQWEEQLAAMIAQERQAPPDDLDSHVVAAALVGVLRSVQRVAVAAEMQLDLPALMDHAFDLLQSGLARFAAHPSQAGEETGQPPVLSHATATPEMAGTPPAAQAPAGHRSQSACDGPARG
jgi:AcrR family transcriptional regulator